MRKIVLGLCAVAALSLAGCGGSNGSDDSGSAPKCSDVWKVGSTLPKDYDGCMNGDTLEVLADFNCKDGSHLASYQDTYYAVLGKTIAKAKTGNTGSDHGYKAAYEKCMPN